MSWLRKILNSKPNKNFQAKSAAREPFIEEWRPLPVNRNKRVLDCLRALEFGAVEIRQALVGLNRIKVKDLARVDGVSAVTIYNTIKGRRTSPKAQELIAQSLGLTVNELFPVGTAAVPPESKEPQG